MASVFLEAEAELQPHLEVVDPAVADVAADLRDLEPVEVAERPARAGDRVADRGVDAVGRRPDDLADGVDVVAHARVLAEGRVRHPIAYGPTVPAVAVVTDSTSYLPRELVAARGIREVSLYVSDGAAQRRELDVSDYARFYDDLRPARDLPTTSQPSVGDFTAVYEPLLAAGDDVVSVHISGGISGTV